MNSAPAFFSGPAILPADLRAWLEQHALSLDQTQAHADLLLPTLAQSGLFGLGVDPALHPMGQGSFADAIQAVVEVAKYSLTAAFVLWAQRAFIECLLAGEQLDLCHAQLDSLVTGKRAGAVGLSNAIKFLGGIESLQVQAQPAQNKYSLEGVLPWVTNVPAQHYAVAAAVQMPDGSQAIWILDHTDQGLQRSANLDLIALRGSHTVAFNVQQLVAGPERILHPDAGQFIQQVRPRFLALQCGMAIGLALRCVKQVLAAPKSTAIQRQDAEHLYARLQALTQALIAQAMDTQKNMSPADLFRVRIEISLLLAEASTLELGSVGGEVYLQGKHPHVLRRTREALFIPLITPSVAQLSAQLAKLDAARAGN